MADKTIGDLPHLENIADSAKIPVEQNNVAYYTAGADWRAFVTDVVSDDVAAAENAATSASSSENIATARANAAAGSAADAVAARTAIENLTVTATTLPAGSTATVSKTVLPGGGIQLNFGLPRGDKGNKGDTGQTGQGTQGPPGGLAQVQLAQGAIYFNIGPGTNPNTGATEQGHLLLTYAGDDFPSGTVPYSIDRIEGSPTYGHLLWTVS